MQWILLICAGLLEIGWPLGFKLAGLHEKYFYHFIALSVVSIDVYKRQIQYEVNPPSQLPTVAIAKHPHTFPPNVNTPTNNTSALIGITVDARKEPINNPQYPKLTSVSIT